MDIQSYEEYEQDWKRSHKADIPRKKRASSFREFFWIGFWVMVATGAAIFSATHTIPAAELTIFKDVPYRGNLAITAFVIVELVIFGAAAGRHDIGWLKWLLLGSVLVALAGNISSSIRAVSENGGDIINQIGGILLAVIAPITALAAGEVLHIQLDKRNEKIDAADSEFQQKWKDMETKIRTAYKRYEKEVKTEISRNFMKNREMNEVHETSQKSSEVPKPRVKLHEVAREIYENGDKELSTSEMMEKYGIGLGSTSKIRDILKSNGFSNGHMQ